ncbi:glycosyltransferase [Flavobacterium sp. WC2429]|uniref:Glycosyltransferase n=1 Tax=Flavobacterium sp. WC2429 TaxID=3234140 RepID=A0AB39WLX5_9FLAO
MNSASENIKINVIFRSCDAVNAVNNSARPFNLDKGTLIKICFKSLLNALEGIDYKMIVIGDALSKETRDFFLKYDIELIEGVFGNDKSILESIKIAEKINSEEWIYFCEDDYLHTKDSFKKILNLIKVKDLIVPGRIKLNQLLRKRTISLFSFKRYLSKPNLVIHPCDYPDRYTIKYATKNFIFHTKDSHWRQISNTTFTFLIEAKELIKLRKTFIKSSKRANDGYLSATLFGRSFFFNKLLCVSPIPSLSTHMHQETMSPIIDWEKLATELLCEIKTEE